MTKKKLLRALILSLLFSIFFCFRTFALEFNVFTIEPLDPPKEFCQFKEPLVVNFEDGTGNLQPYLTTVYVCSEANCSPISVYGDGELITDNLNCYNYITINNVPPGCYYIEAYGCGESYADVVCIGPLDSEYVITICPPSRDYLCPPGNGCHVSGSGKFVCYSCSAEYLIDDENALSNLRQFRDEVLATDPIGQNIIELYDDLSPLIIKFMESHPKIKKMSKDIITHIAK